MTKTFPKEVMLELLWGDEYMDEDFHLVTVKNELVETSRWSTHHELIFRDVNEDRFYFVDYSKGATETQDESPFDYEPENIEVDEVYKVSQIVSTFVTSENKFTQKRSKMLDAIAEMISLKDEVEREDVLECVLSSMDGVGNLAKDYHEYDLSFAEKTIKGGN